MWKSGNGVVYPSEGGDGLRIWPWGKSVIQVCFVSDSIGLPSLTSTHFLFGESSCQWIRAYLRVSTGISDSSLRMGGGGWSMLPERVEYKILVKCCSWSLCLSL
jgi:hypothetical protein